MNCFIESHTEKFKDIVESYSKELQQTKDFIDVKINTW